MPNFSPFRALRYQPDRVVLDDVIAPPYDVLSLADRAELAARSPYNAVHVDAVHLDAVHLDAMRGDAMRGDAVPAATDPSGESPVADCYRRAAERLRQWTAAGVMAEDPEPAFYAYAMGFNHSNGQPGQTLGVIGALELADPASGEVLAHEHTLPRARADRHRLLGATRANLSAVWCLSLADGLGDLPLTDGPPLARATDSGGVHHRLWAIRRPAVIESIQTLVDSAPVVIADGHHRYETALDFHRSPDGERSPGSGRIMAFVVGLAGADLGVAAIHRLLPPDFPTDPEEIAARAGLVARPLAAGSPFDNTSLDRGEGQASDWLAAADGPVLITAAGRWRVSPRDGGPTRGIEVALADSELVAPLLESVGLDRVGFSADAHEVVAQVDSGRAGAGLLLRPVVVGAIADAARIGRRFPHKTSNFHPKPATRMVMRSQDDT
ncbi:MAG: DUF1015 family protein [Acidimicrobiales bacterium]